MSRDAELKTSIKLWYKSGLLYPRWWRLRAIIDLRSTPGRGFFKKNLKPYSVTIPVTRAQAYENEAAVVQSMDNAIHWVNLYPVYNAIGRIFLVNGRNFLLPNYTYPLDRDLSGG